MPVAGSYVHTWHLVNGLVDKFGLDSLLYFLLFSWDIETIYQRDCRTSTDDVWRQWAHFVAAFWTFLPFIPASVACKPLGHPHEHQTFSVFVVRLINIEIISKNKSNSPKRRRVAKNKQKPNLRRLLICQPLFSIKLDFVLIRLTESRNDCAHGRSHHKWRMIG